MEELIFVKLGGSVITDKKKPFTAKEKVIERLGREISSAQKKYKGKIVIVHGSGSFGHIFASKYATHKGLLNRDSLLGFTKTANAAAQINRITTSSLLKSGIKAVSFAPLSLITSKKEKVQKYFVHPIEICLRLGAVPVVYGDVIMDFAQGFCIFSGEEVIEILLKELSRKYKIRKIIQCGITDGVYDKDDKTISVITAKEFSKLKKYIKGSYAKDVTGGMLHKVEKSLEIAKNFGVVTEIINANKSGNLRRAILGEKIRCTFIKRS